MCVLCVSNQNLFLPKYYINCMQTSPSNLWLLYVWYQIVVQRIMWGSLKKEKWLQRPTTCLFDNNILLLLQPACPIPIRMHPNAKFNDFIPSRDRYIMVKSQVWKYFIYKIKAVIGRSTLFLRDMLPSSFILCEFEFQHFSVLFTLNCLIFYTTHSLEHVKTWTWVRQPFF